MPIQIQEIMDNNEGVDCPLCMEPLEVDDINFFPCACGYQICRFCWHRIRTDENGLCPACRSSYPENPAEFKPLTGSDLQKIRQERRQKEVQRRQKISDCRRHLGQIRVLQKNLVFVVGLSQRLADAEMLKRQEYFGKYGKIMKVVINNNTAYAGSQGPSCSAYVTYSRMEEALRAIQSVNNVHIDGRTLKASLGTTKYCSTYLKNQQCHKTDCMYLHDLADEEASFTKEEMQSGKHQEFEQKLIKLMIQKETESERNLSNHHTNSDSYSESNNGNWKPAWGATKQEEVRITCVGRKTKKEELEEFFRSEWCISVSPKKNKKVKK